MATGEAVRLKIEKATKMPKATGGRCHGNLRRLVCSRPCRLPRQTYTPVTPRLGTPRDAAVGSHLVSALVGEPVTNWVQLLIATATALLGALGLAYWAYRAHSDRSALVGLYLLFGIPAALLLLAGAAVLIRGDRVLGPVLLLIGLGLGVPLVRPVREALARVTPLDPDSAIDMTGLSIVLG